LLDGNTTSEEGAAPKLHCNVAPMTTWTPKANSLAEAGVELHPHTPPFGFSSEPVSRAGGFEPPCSLRSSR
jgi:hypothetical protein